MLSLDALNSLDFASLAALANDNSPWLFLALVIFAMLQEDIATATIALLAAHGHVPVQLGFSAVLTGIYICDIGIFFGGWFARGHRYAYGLLKRAKVRRVKRVLKNNLIPTILITRALPGMRLPTFFALGFFHADPIRFILIAGGAVSLWSAFLFSMTYIIGNQVLTALEGPWFWVVVVLLLAVVLVVPRLIIKRLPVVKQMEQS